jgi:integrase/recombinase XerD
MLVPCSKRCVANECRLCRAQHKRHSKAMHLLQSGVNLIYIRDFLGHADYSTTEIYARSDTEMKRKAIENAYNDLLPNIFPDWEKDGELMEWLNSITK